MKPFLTTFILLTGFSCSSTFTKQEYESSIEEVVNGHQIDLDRCYEKEWKKNPELKGVIIMGWTIDIEGNVVRPHIVQSNVNNPALEDCVRTSITFWKFPKPENGRPLVIREHGFEFEPDSIWDKIF